MSETPVHYLLNPDTNHAIMDADKVVATQDSSDWAQMERMLIPLVNYVRKKQGKKPVVVPKG